MTGRSISERIAHRDRAILAQPFVAEWMAAANQERWMIPEFEPEGRAEG